MVQTSLSVQTKVLLISSAALAAGLAAYALGYYDYDWRLWQGTPNQIQQQPPVTQLGGDTGKGDEQQVVPTQPTLQVATLTSDARLPDALVGKPYTTTLTASTGVNTRWTLEQGALPSGLTFDEARGVISGIPTQPDTYVFRVKFGNNELTGISQLTLNVVTGEGVVAATTPQTNQARITTDALPTGRMGEAYSVQLKAEGGVETARTWRLQGASVPGLTMNEQGQLAGMPTQAGTFLVSVVLKTVDVPSQTQSYEVTRQYSLVIEEAKTAVKPDVSLKIVSNNLLPAGRVGTDYKFQFTATGAPATDRYIWQNLNSKVPGLVGTEDGLLSGVPTAVGTYNLQMVSVRLRDTAGIAAATDFQIQILPKENTVVPPNPPKPPEQTDRLLISGGYPDGGIGNYYSSSVLSASGGQPPYEWSVSGGNLPTGLYMAANSQIAGYANQYGIFTFTIQVRDQANQIARVDRTISIRPSQPVISTTIDPDLSNRLRRIDLMGVQVHDLIKLQDDGNPDTQYDTTVYYIGADGRRHSFPNPKVYFSWFPDFSRVRIVASRELADIPLGANITYRPGTHLVKFATDPRVYAVDSDRRLRWVKTESVAEALYGPFWARQVDDVSDAFYMDYRFGQDVDRPGDYSTSAALRTAVFPSDVLPR